MVYSGGKSKLGKELYKVMEKYIHKQGYQKHKYFEPFCGLLGTAQHFVDEYEVIISDKNKDLILMLKALQRGWTPPAKPCTKKEYDEMRQSKKHSKERGFYGFTCGYSGIFFSGYRVKSGNRNFFQEARNSIMKLIPSLKKMRILGSADYREIEPSKCIIYCDPPYYKNTFKSEHFSDFDFQSFWETMGLWAKKNLVFVSEYSFPKNMGKIIWKKTMNSTYNFQTKEREEKLFLVKA